MPGFFFAIIILLVGIFTSLYIFHRSVENSNPKKVWFYKNGLFILCLLYVYFAYVVNFSKPQNDKASIKESNSMKPSLIDTVAKIGMSTSAQKKDGNRKNIEGTIAYLYHDTLGSYNSATKSKPTTVSHINQPTPYNKSSIPIDGLVAYYPFNGNANDESGNGNNGITNGGMSWGIDRFGNENGAASFNGTNAYISIPNSFSIQSPTNALTISSWIYINNFYNGVAPVCHKSNTTEYGQYGIQIYNRDGAWAFHETTQRGSSTVSGSYIFQKGEWYHLAISWDGNTIKYFINDVLNGTRTLIGPLIMDSFPLEIGRDTPGQTEYLNGRLDDFRIYNHALSDTEIQALFRERY